MGKPIRRWSEISLLVNFQSSVESRKEGNRLKIYHTHARPDKSCATTVATPAPATPKGVYRINTTSKTMLNKQAITKKISGVLESPKALKALESTLNNIVVGIPANTTTK